MKRPKVTDLSITGVCERDIDLLLLEEFHAGDRFWRWLAGMVLGEHLAAARFVRARHSVDQSSGESDLELAIEVPAGRRSRRSRPRRIRILFENKLDAMFQPQQAERYRQRGDAYLQNGECDRWVTVLLAPKVYLGWPEHGEELWVMPAAAPCASGKNATRRKVRPGASVPCASRRDAPPLHGFDAVVTYEAMREWFRKAPRLGARRTHKLALLDGAIRKAEEGYRPVPDEPVTAFWQRYWELAQDRAPELNMARPEKKPAAAGFVHFHPVALPKGAKLVHKLRHGKVDLQFTGGAARVPELQMAIEPLLDRGMALARAGKAVAVRIAVPAVDAARGMDTQQSAAEAGLAAARRLSTWLARHRQVIEQLMVDR
ncbi:MAG TPA: hypothetical protein PK176_14275 [Acidobacteriota bacterium]|nr:hypothetical protein [Acidobacteriota bacterium]HQM64472.1 hypothetical protein [Acidobacteriota bacterium]